MRAYLNQGILLGLGYVAITLILAFAGFHSDPSKFPAATDISFFANLALGILLMVRGVRARRLLTPPIYDFPFGLAMGIAVFIALVGGIVAALFQFFYMWLLNPTFSETAIQAGLAELQKSGASADHLKQSEELLRTLYRPAIYPAFRFLLATTLNVIVAAAIAGIMRRKAVAESAP
ncbi:MAG: DUF4199 domain-containing protein [Nibricoccus sp.]